MIYVIFMLTYTIFCLYRIAGLLILLLDFYEFRQTLGIGGIKLTNNEPSSGEGDALSIPDMEP
jgi:hypothetical protein